VSHSELVYSTDGGDRRGPKRQRGSPPRDARPPSDGVVRVSREQSGRRGKTVTVVHGLAATELKAVGRDLKRLCGSGGSVKNGALEIQGDHRDTVVAHLQSEGRHVKLAGG
jgi:translation initiation factor 1